MSIACNACTQKDATHTGCCHGQIFDLVIQNPDMRPCMESSTQQAHCCINVWANQTSGVGYGVLLSHLTSLQSLTVTKHPVLCSCRLNWLGLHGSSTCAGRGELTASAPHASSS